MQRTNTPRTYSKGLAVVISERAVDGFNFPPTVFIENLISCLMTMYYICNSFLKSAILRKPWVEVTLEVIAPAVVATANIYIALNHMAGTE